MSNAIPVTGQDSKPWPQTTDAHAWATEFCRLNSASDHGTMLGWFANAIMIGYDNGCLRNLVYTADLASLREAIKALPEPEEIWVLANANGYQANYYTDPELAAAVARLKEMVK